MRDYSLLALLVGTVKERPLPTLLYIEQCVSTIFKMAKVQYILELVLWELPKKTIDRPHGYKYRLYFGDCEGKCLVRYDNENGKGDHKHIGEQEIAYEFVDRDKLIKDFYNDVIHARKNKEV